MQNKIEISVIMPTYNASCTLEESLKSIRMQSYNQNQIEILIVDGGSTDCTIEIAQKYNAIILENKKRLPEYAKEIGLEYGHGKYAIYMDSDEVLIDKNTLQKRVQVFLDDQNIKGVVSDGLICNKTVKPIARYANYTGDPFSYFIYQYNGYKRTESMSKTYQHENRKEYILYKFKENDSLPLFDAGVSMFDLTKAKQLYIDYKDKKNFASNLFNILMNDSHCIAIVEGDLIYHLPQMDLRGYMAKLKWRVLNNIFGKKEGQTGFASRARTDKKINKRKFLYVIYSVTLVGPIYDSIKLTIKNRDGVFLLHVFLNLYVFGQICWNMVLKLLHKTPKTLLQYGK